jgi:predicted SAM-dependent methyltransferase
MRTFRAGSAAKSAIQQSELLTTVARAVRHFVKRQTGARKWKANIQAYLANHPIKKLEIGARVATLEGWLNTDIDPVSDDVVYLDATQPFPFESGTFDYIYCEHMIEHISWKNGQKMLKECHRVLKPRGMIRIATPDLAVILGLYSTCLSAEQRHYIDWMVQKELPDVSEHKASFVINNAFRNWGHQFIYDDELMAHALSLGGFVDIKRCVYGESTEESLRQIETHGMHIGDDQIARFESLIFEGTRPAETVSKSAAAEFLESSHPRPQNTPELAQTRFGR